MKPHHVEKTYAITIGAFLQIVQRLAPQMGEGGRIVTMSGMDTHRYVAGHGILAQLGTKSAPIRHAGSEREAGVDQGRRFLSSEQVPESGGGHQKTVRLESDGARERLGPWRRDDLHRSHAWSALR
jgi:hypothetical protein